MQMSAIPVSRMTLFQLKKEIWNVGVAIENAQKTLNMYRNVSVKCW